MDYSDFEFVVEVDRATYVAAASKINRLLRSGSGGGERFLLDQKLRMKLKRCCHNVLAPTMLWGLIVWDQY